MAGFRAKKHNVFAGRLYYPGDVIDAEALPSEHWEPTEPAPVDVEFLPDENKDPGQVNLSQVITQGDPGQVQDPGTADLGAAQTGTGEAGDPGAADDLSKMTVKQLEELAAARGIELPSKANKAVIVGMLMQQ